MNEQELTWEKVWHTNPESIKKQSRPVNSYFQKAYDFIVKYGSCKAMIQEWNDRPNATFREYKNFAIPDDIVEQVQKCSALF